MIKFHNQSLSKSLTSISIAAILPMFMLSSYLLWALSSATNAYSGINNNISYANKHVIDIKERIDYTMYLAVIGNKSIDEIFDIMMNKINEVRKYNENRN